MEAGGLIFLCGFAAGALTVLGSVWLALLWVCWSVGRDMDRILR